MLRFIKPKGTQQVEEYSHFLPPCKVQYWTLHGGQIKLNARDLAILHRIKEFFGGAGEISIEKNSAKFIIIKLSDIVDKVIPHFEAYPLLTKKYADFSLFRRIVLILNQESRLNVQGFIKVLNLPRRGPSRVPEGTPRGVDIT